MYTLKFTDLQNEFTEFKGGTCDFCSYTTTVNKSVLVVKILDEDGNYVRHAYIDGYTDNCGTFQGIQIDDIIDFGLWFDANDITVWGFDSLGYSDVAKWVDEYNQYRDVLARN